MNKRRTDQFEWKSPKKKKIERTKMQTAYWLFDAMTTKGVCKCKCKTNLINKQSIRMRMCTYWDILFVMLMLINQFAIIMKQILTMKLLNIENLMLFIGSTEIPRSVDYGDGTSCFTWNRTFYIPFSFRYGKWLESDFFLRLKELICFLFLSFQLQFDPITAIMYTIDFFLLCLNVSTIRNIGKWGFSQ